MQLYDALRLCTIDFTDTQLTDDEVAEMIMRMQKEASIESEKQRRRWAKARNFAWKGGMC